MGLSLEQKQAMVSEVAAKHAGLIPVGGAPEAHSPQVAAEQQMWSQAPAAIGYRPE